MCSLVCVLHTTVETVDGAQSPTDERESSSGTATASPTAFECAATAPPTVRRTPRKSQSHATPQRLSSLPAEKEHEFRSSKTPYIPYILYTGILTCDSRRVARYWFVMWREVSTSYHGSTRTRTSTSKSWIPRWVRWAGTGGVGISFQLCSCRAAQQCSAVRRKCRLSNNSLLVHP
ncbi:hypothetical protein BZA05DRAFT_219529 [Tricharina praecox]|uniref:uncharacterized protein n=1 Tax=Tricharina praecox TaxID=43433 RepID=UPI00221F19EE|nr:uncharacterized protein BZA05DRAFT_219529 [Tricharina praecox]KAI5855854.1 hypothetical protein BZA05DRAFT_219529 [Tricharina praecox]